MMRTFPALAALLAALAAVTAAQPGYLSEGRLAPLRFQEAPAPGRSVLPALPPEGPSPSFPIPTNSAASSASEASAATTTEQSDGGVEPATNEVTVTPQMLVGFYRDGIAGTNHDAGTIVPFGFVPPTTAPKPSSTAGYSSQ
ncbi:MAG: hypothetical protein ABSA12_07215 [Verrucomicrobiia bacterium]